MSRTRPLAPFLAALAALPLAACVSPLTAEGPVGPAAATDSTEAALEAAHARWQAAGPAAYEFVYEASCFCPPEYRGPFTLTVRDGAVREAYYAGRAVDPTDPRYPTVDQLFAQLAEAFDREAESVRVAYDEALGYPATAYVDYEALMADEELSFTIRRLTPLDG